MPVSRSSASSRWPGSSSPTTPRKLACAPSVADVVGHVGGGADALFLARDLDHGHRRFGRDAVHRAVPVAVEHGVADHQDARLGELLLAWVHVSEFFDAARRIAVPGLAARALPEVLLGLEAAGGAAVARERLDGLVERALHLGWNCSCSSFSPASHGGGHQRGLALAGAARTSARAASLVGLQRDDALRARRATATARSWRCSSCERLRLARRWPRRAAASGWRAAAWRRARSAPARASSVEGAGRVAGRAAAARPGRCAGRGAARRDLHGLAQQLLGGRRRRAGRPARTGSARAGRLKLAWSASSSFCATSAACAQSRERS